MTTVTGFEIIACPGCGARYRLPTYGSIFFSDRQEWSDGRIRFRLYKPASGVSVCPCGTVFLHSECERVARMTWVRPGYAPAPPRPRRSLWAVLRGDPPIARPPGPRGRYDTEIFAGEPWPEFPEPPDWAPQPSAAVFIAAADALALDTPSRLEVALRRELWRLLNDPARPSKDSPEMRGDPTANPAWVANLERLHGLLARDDCADRIQVGETLRQLGRFDEASTVFRNVDGKRAPLASFLADLAARKVTRVMLIPEAVFDAMSASE